MVSGWVAEELTLPDSCLLALVCRQLMSVAYGPFAEHVVVAYRRSL